MISGMIRAWRWTQTCLQDGALYGTAPVPTTGMFLQAPHSGSTLHTAQRTNRASATDSQLTSSRSVFFLRSHCYNPHYVHVSVTVKMRHWWGQSRSITYLTLYTPSSNAHFHLCVCVKLTFVLSFLSEHCSRWVWAFPQWWVSSLFLHY